MRTLNSIAAAGAVWSMALTAAFAGDIPANIASAIENPNRSEENRARDGDRKPAEVLAFFGVKEGMTVVDIASGGGYFSEILSGAVGPDGDVRAQNRAGPRMDDKQKAALAAQYAKFGNIALDVTEPGQPLPYADNSVDMVLLSLIIHHLHYDEASGDAMPESSAAVYADFKRILKPGGTFAIIEHKAPDGTSRAQSAGWHRISEDVMKADVTSAGFEFASANDVIHNNPDDDERNTWFETGLRGKTTRLVHIYRKPS